MYLNVIQLAESFGVEERAVEGWIRNDGLPFVEDRGRLLFDRRQVVEWAAQRGLAAKAGFLAPAASALRADHSLDRLLRAGGIWRDVLAADVLSILERIVTALPGTTAEVRRLLGQRLRAPGGITWAPVGRGLALPHSRSPVALGRDAGLVAILLLRDPLCLEETPPDGVPVTRLLFFIAPSPRAHLELLSQLSAALTHGGLRQVLLEGGPDAEIFAAFAAEANARSASTKGHQA